MVFHDDLIANNVLFEGSDWDTWKESLMQLCRVHGYLECHIDESSYEDMLEEGLTHEECMEAYQPILMLIKCHVQPTLMDRTSKDSAPYELMETLEMLAEPFRLTDLPEELQIRVYRYAFVGSHCYVGPAWIVFAREFPALLQTSRQIRRAALPVYYGNTTFAARCRTVDDVHALKMWAALVAGHSIRYLTHMSVTVPWKYGRKPSGEMGYTTEARYLFKWSPANGLQLTETPKLKADVAKALMEQERATNAYGKAVDLGGEAIILAITTALDTWTPVHFRPGDDDSKMFPGKVVQTASKTARNNKALK
jgi:hypothetical protein